MWAPWASVSCGGGAGAPPFAGPAPVARVGPVRKRRRPLEGLARCRLGGEVPRRPWGPFGHRMVAGGVRGPARCRLGGEVPRCPWGPFGHRMVAAGVRLVRGWWLVRRGWVCGRGARWLPSRPLVLFVYGGLWPGGVGRWAVVVVGVVLVVVVVGPLVVVVCVVVGLVLWVWPMESLWVFRSPLWGWGVGHRGQSPGLHYVVGMGEGLGAGLDGDDG